MIGGGVAAGVGDEARLSDLVAMQLRASVDGFGLELCGVFGVRVVQLVDGAVGIVLQTPGAAQVDDFDAVRDRLGDPLARLLVRRREEEHFDA